MGHKLRYFYQVHLILSQQKDQGHVVHAVKYLSAAT